MKRIIDGENKWDGIWLHQTTPTNEYCEKHDYYKRYFAKIQKNICPFCEREKKDEELEKLSLLQYQREFKRKREYFLNKYSSLNEEIRVATLDNYEVSTPEEEQALEFANKIAEEYISEAKNNVVLIGKSGSGKSHLSHGIAKLVSDTKEWVVPYVNIVDFMTRVDYKNKASMIERIVEAKLVVIDDLGSEMDNQLTRDVVYEIFDKRTRTLITTNLTGEELIRRYSNRTYSRIMKGVDESHFMKFDNMKDRRRLLF
ncbi:DNA replication protein [Streptococcus agalactiae]|uniref:DNA replication protein n=1 Tax=Streptococcus agalactiae TaxID=1311 RepID=A0A380J0P0_STRAG|nr:ATP-binding protein [Streptococcus agalactiae]SUN03027.1 DNA replication protein [Streptococcus agalactiae]SUN13065.1 DNA replication protein [Streptococcus agalactiae]SUN26706.1 DNA replication protein [Streptococcus agalactiae]SUN28171.1 DNA replication protein [Streptococcus agalactiae]